MSCTATAGELITLPRTSSKKSSKKTEMCMKVRWREGRKERDRQRGCKEKGNGRVRELGEWGGGSGEREGVEGGGRGGLGML